MFKYFVEIKPLGACTQIHTHTHTHARTHAHTHTHTHARTHARTHRQTDRETERQRETETERERTLFGSDTLAFRVQKYVGKLLQNIAFEVQKYVGKILQDRDEVTVLRRKIVWGCSSVGRASDLHAADAGLIPGYGYFFKSHLSVQTLLRCPYTPVCTGINICARVKDLVVHVRVRWILETLKHRVCTTSSVARLCRSWLSLGGKQP